LSTLTKVLIVLLTVFAIFLCGIVVTYVANAENQRERADRLQRDIQSARRTQEAAVQDLEAEKQRAQNEKAQLDAQINELGLQVKQLEGELDGIKRENAQLVQKVAAMAATVETANATATQQTTLFETTQQEVQGLRADQTNRKKELDETNQMLMEKMAVIAQLQQKVRQLTEENQELGARYNQYLQQYGRMTTRPATTVGPAQPPAPAPTPPQTKAIGLSGRVTAVDMKLHMAQISIGSAAGVRPDMKFYITRGDRFVANILVLEVTPDSAVGILDLVQTDPLVGDVVTTNL
jgi:peptidoglycan hydrolase CwlO-like protein